MRIKRTAETVSAQFQNLKRKMKCNLETQTCRFLSNIVKYFRRIFLQPTETNTECQSQQTDHIKQVTVQAAHVKDEILVQVSEVQRSHLDSVEL